MGIPNMYIIMELNRQSASDQRCMLGDESMGTIQRCCICEYVWERM